MSFRLKEDALDRQLLHDHHDAESRARLNLEIRLLDDAREHQILATHLDADAKDR